MPTSPIASCAAAALAAVVIGFVLHYGSLLALLHRGGTSADLQRLHRSEPLATAAAAAAAGRTNPAYANLPLQAYTSQRLFHQVNTSYPGLQLVRRHCRHQVNTSYPRLQLVHRHCRHCRAAACCCALAAALRARA